MERIKTAYDLAWASYRWNTLTVGKQLPGGYVVKSVLKGKGVLGESQQCFYAVSGQTGVIACSGSDDMYDWISNFIAFRTSWPEVDGSRRATFHLGTLNTFDTSIKPWLDKLQLAPKLMLTGHSLGGMTTQFVALYLHHVRKHRGLEIFTFGAPFIGNDAAARLMAATAIPARCVSVQGDPVSTLTMPYMISGYAPWGVPSATATQRSIVIFGDDVSKRIGYRYELPAYALPLPRSFSTLHMAYPTVLANIISALKAQRCTYSPLSFHADKDQQCVGSKALCVKRGVAAPAACGSAGYCNLSSQCYMK